MGTQTLRQFFEDSLRIEGYDPTPDKMECMINSYNELITKPELDLDMIIKAHNHIVSFQDNAAELTGLRKCHVRVGNSVKMSPDKVSEELKTWIEKFNNPAVYFNFSYNRMLTGYDLHFDFEIIHPFADGNGRIGRNLWLIYISKIMEYSWLINIIDKDSLDKEVPWFLQYAYYNNFRYLEDK